MGSIAGLLGREVLTGLPAGPPVPPPRKRPQPRQGTSHWRIPPRFVIGGAIVLLLIGIAAGKGWAALENGRLRTSRNVHHAVSTTIPPIPTTTPTEPSTTTTTVDPEAALRARIVPSEGYWQAIHQCEQPDTWFAVGVFGNGLHGGGGLGISDGAWHAWGGDEFASYPAGASPLQQEVIASVGYQRVGPGAWGCRA